MVCSVNVHHTINKKGIPLPKQTVLNVLRDWPLLIKKLIKKQVWCANVVLKESE